MKLHYAQVLLCLPLVFLSCKKSNPQIEESLISTKDKKLASNVLEVDYFVNELEFIARSIKTAYPNQPGLLSGTTITTGTTEEGKVKYDIVFNDIKGPDNKIRKGKLTVVFENAMENGNVVTGKSLHVRSDDENNLYSVSDIKFKGSLVFSNIEAAKSSTNTPITHINAQSFLIKPGIEEIKFSSGRKSRWMSGSNTPETDDDTFEITEQDYSLTVTTDSETDFVEGTTENKITLAHACTQSPFVPKKGALKIKNNKTQNIFYVFLGNGNCADLPIAYLK